MIRGIEHIGICSIDTDSMKDWYVRLFGCSIAYENNKSPKTYILHFPDSSMIEIYPAAEDSENFGNKTRGIRHLALAAENFDEMCKALRDNKVEITEEAKTSATGVRTIFFRDPEDNLYHLIERPAPLVPGN